MPALYRVCLVTGASTRTVSHHTPLHLHTSSRVHNVLNRLLIRPFSSRCPRKLNPRFVHPTRLPYTHIAAYMLHFASIYTFFQYVSAHIRSQRKAAEKAEHKAAKSTKSKKGGPKRALSAYMFFSQDWRERIKTENPDAGFGQCIPPVGVRYPYESCLQGRSANCLAPNGRNSTKMRRRYARSYFSWQMC